jgi:hypothetical protein
MMSNVAWVTPAAMPSEGYGLVNTRRHLDPILDRRPDRDGNSSSNALRQEGRVFRVKLR